VEEVTGRTGSGRVAKVHWARQVHGSTVIVVSAGQGHVTHWADRPTAVVAGEADALVAERPADALAVLTADCASIALGSPEGVFGAVHAGWRGLVAGVVERAVDVMRDRGASEVVGALGPCIRPECYEFSETDLDRVAAHLGDGVRARTEEGSVALDLPTAVAVALARAGAIQRPTPSPCTGCGGGYFSHRARGDQGRQALVVWSTGDQ
jgi:copper oxidase (laccase) domain-containing protein